MWDSNGLTSHSVWQEFSTPVLLAYGAKLNAFIAAPNHQWWRFVTPMFIHVNLLHLLVNMYSLWVLGPYVEKLYGSTKFVVFWVVTGIAGVVASYLTVTPNLAVGLGRFIFKAHDEPSAGASGALFGLVGVLFVFGIKFRHELPEGFKRAFGTGLLPVIMINLFIGFLGRGFIDNAAHLGGLLSGAALATVVQYRRPGESQGSAIVWRILQVAALLLVAFSFFKVAQNFNPPKAQPQVTNRDVLLNYVNVMNQAHEVIAAVLYENDVSTVGSTLQALQTTAAPDPKADDLRKRLIDLLSKAKSEVEARPSPQPGPRRTPKLDVKLVGDFALWNNDYNAWLKTAVQTLNQ
jgi:rhomboid protease GluP